MDNPYITISTIVIACVAVCISIWQGWVTRQHNKLSVKPILEIFTSTTKDGTSMGVRVENHGTGPAIIKDFFVYFKGKPTKVDNREKADNIYRAANLYTSKINLWHPHKSGAVIKQGGTVNLISYVEKNLTIQDVEKFEEKLSHLHFKFIYESIYKEKFEVSNET
jgi:hypothetical protein